MREEVIIRNALITDEDKIIEFIKEHWYIKNHVFTRNRELFENIHIVDNKLNFVIGEGEATKKIYGILGYLITNRSNHPDIAGAMFQTIPSSNVMLGIDILLEAQRLTKCRALISSGIREETIPIYNFLGYSTGALKHYYQLNDRCDFRIAFIKKFKRAIISSENYTFKELKNLDEVLKIFSPGKYTSIIPYKDEWYIERHFFKNIGYIYQVYGIINENNACEALFCGRVINCNGHKCFKIVDFIGTDQELSHCSEAFRNMIMENNYEYIDFYEFGIPDSVMENAGFIYLDTDDENIIPQYFEPFVQQNITINYMTTDIGNYHGYRMDGGQERPNLI